jgi:hypothetical protein
MKYDKFSYIFPPRPETALPPKLISQFDNGEYYAQPKLNGSCMVLFINGTTKEVIVKNRHQDSFSRMTLDLKELAELNNDKGWMVLVGEYLNKGQTDHSEKKFNDKFVIFDILVKNNIYLIGKSFKERLQLIDELFPGKNSNGFIKEVSNNVFVVNSFTDSFNEKYEELTKAQLYEGLVLKRATSKLEVGYKEKNNTTGMLKFRKEHKNYKF